MSREMPSRSWGSIILLGAVWGLAEAGLGLALKSCASQASGSIMTAFALLFVGAAWSCSGWMAGLPVLVLITSLFKLFDARLLSLSVRSGAVANPIFAFVTEALAFALVFGLARKSWASRLPGRSILGGASAFMAVAVFPLVKFCTGIPACVVPGTHTPLAWYYAPWAVGLSLVTVPLGVWAGQRLSFMRTKAARLVVPVGVAVCLALVVLIHHV
jgi:hypothetical protein